jgi:hypothetical protein
MQRNRRRRNQHGSKPAPAPVRSSRERMRELPADYRRAMERTFSECGLTDEKFYHYSGIKNKCSFAFIKPSATRHHNR